MLRLTEAELKKLKARRPGIPNADLSKVGSKPPRKALKLPRHPVCVYAGEPLVFEFPVTPQVKQRARVVAYTKEDGSAAVRGVTPTATREFEAGIRLMAAAQMQGRQPFTCPVEVEVVVWIKGDKGEWPTGHRDGDADNHLKAVGGDAINGIAFLDDRLVVRATIEKRCRPVPGLTVTVRPARP